MKQKTIIALTVIGVLLVATIGATFAYFVANSQNDGNNTTTGGTTKELTDLILTDGVDVTSNNIIPGESVTSTFTVQNQNDIEVCFGLVWTNVINTFTNTNDLIVTLQKSDGTVLISDTANQIFPTANDTELISGLKISGETTDTYTITITYKNTDQNQIADMNATFSGTITGTMTECPPPTATETILSLAEANPDQLAYDETSDNNLRYIGANPNNYVDIGDRYGEGAVINHWEKIGFEVNSVEECNNAAEMFNCNNYADLGFSTIEDCNTNLPLMLEQYYNVSNSEEFKSTYCVQEDVSNKPILWRIIGVMNNIDDGTGKKETRLKIIRYESIGNYSWDNQGYYGENDWSTSALQQVLNSGAYYNRMSGECPYGRNGATTPCDFSTTGLTEEAKSMIDNAIWNLGGSNGYNDVTASMFYERERGTETYQNSRLTEWTGQIGLMYPSDYGYATSGGSTGRDICLSYDLNIWNDYRDCYNNGWLYNASNYQWTITSDSRYSDEVLVIHVSGNVSYDYAADTYSAVFPATYLSSNVKITGGSGQESDPFTLSL